MARVNRAQTFAYKCALPPRSLVWDPLSRETPTIPRHLGSARAIPPQDAQNITFGNFPMLPQIPNYQCCACIFFRRSQAEDPCRECASTQWARTVSIYAGCFGPHVPAAFGPRPFVIQVTGQTPARQAGRLPPRARSISVWGPCLRSQSSIYISLAGSLSSIYISQGRPRARSISVWGRPKSSIYISMGLNFRARSMAVWV